ncbi:hypothetical protein [Gulosibacter molinativorax]|uniref:Uncharacterized protein n=1 Tax=Gulosibacter molinativorax TaxID=256821 RepID=A0ABT7C827_9MICO|nr:hypothetical protein [Gulosibacter molinativorax]MDJ1371220.1 hypothetical protein [Gulosibacter molinativorax]QUY63036.1 Putative membrane protein [Gulosibacter molinativorax]
MSSVTLISTGIVILIVITIAFGGTFLLRVVGGNVPANELQRSYFRAGHAHAGVLVILGLLVRLWVELGGAPEWSALLADGVLFAAILMPAGFFLSVIGRDPEKPNGLKLLIWLGALSLTIGVGAAGIGLIVAGANA